MTGVVTPARTLALGALAGVVCLASGCLRRDSDTQGVRQHDQGKLCLGAASGEGDAGPHGLDLRADQPLAISVRSACLSDACATNRTAKCGVRREGSKLVVTSDLAWTAPTDLERRCPGDCSHLEATCSTEALPPGKYSVVLGDRTFEVALPSHLPGRCLGDPTPVVVAAVAPPPSPSASAPTEAGAGAGVPATLPANVDARDVPSAPGTGVAPSPPPKDVICVGPANAAQKSRAIKAGQPLAISIIKKNPCLGASCSAATAKCVAKRKGTHVVLTATFPGPTTKPRKLCTDDCNALVATCKTDNLPAGTYTLELGAQHETVTVPAANAPPCAGQ